jgi:hypothetical protein
MAAAPRSFLLIAVVAISTQGISAQRSKEISITEPGRYELAELFRKADTVAVVKVLSGDTENYDRAVYKGQVVKSFKGAEVGETVYFGPYIGERLGYEYFLFLRNASNPLAPKKTSEGGYGTIHYFAIFDEGYSSMETSYECVFDGKEITKRCDYGVRVCTDYIVIPKSTPSLPPASEETPFGCRWVRKEVFISLLEKMGDAKK